MKVRLLAFATAGQLLGSGSRTLELPPGTRLSDLKSRLEAEDPRWLDLWPRLAIAVAGRLRKDDPELAEGDEIALLPPVSGGSPEPSSHLTYEPLDLDAARREVEAPERGAVLLFLGTVRNHHAGRPVLGLTYSAYESMAEERLATICRELEATSAGLRVLIRHRLGEVPAGEPSVVIAVASPHREAAYEASRAALERLKKEVPIWKLERYADGAEAWREEESLVG